MPSRRSPSVFHYTNFRDFIRAWKRARPTTNTYSRLAQQVNCSLPHLSNMLSEDVARQRPLSPRYLDRFCAALRLDEEEAEFFRLLVRFEQAASEAERQRVWQQIAAERRFHEAHSLLTDQYEFFAQWTHLAILTLAHAPGFRSKLAWISHVLRPRISKAEARRAIEVLLRLGLLRRDEEQNLVPVADMVVDRSRMDPQVGRPARYQLARWMLERAQQILDSREFPTQDRVFNAGTMLVPESRMPEVHRRLHSFQKELVFLCEATEGGEEQDSALRHRVYRLNLQFFPLSDWVPASGGRHDEP